MSEPAKSIYADQLEQLGFKKWARTHSLDSIERTYELVVDPISEPSPPSYTVFATKPPYFMIVYGMVQMTEATDETGQVWICRGKCVDLTSIGFVPMFQTQTLQ